jgi:cobalt-zinc-cadmium efflux system outer membrane protein
MDLRTSLPAAVLGVLAIALVAGRAPAMTLGDAVDRAIERNPAVRASYQAYESALSKEREIPWLQDPVITLGYQEGGWMPDESMKMLMLDQPIPFPTKTSGSKSRARLLGRVEEARYMSAKRKTVKNVKSAYINLLLVQETISIYEENLDDALMEKESARQQYETGAAPYHDMVRTRVDALLAENDLETLRSEDLVEATANLRAVLDMEDDEEIGEIELPAVPIMSVSVESLETFMPSRSPELDEFRLKAAAAGEELSIARQRYIPDLRLRLFTDRMESDVGEADRKGIMVLFNLPLWFWNTEAAKDAKTHSLGAAESVVRSEENRIGAELEAGVAAFRAARERLSLLEDDIIPEAELSYTSAVTAYESGSMDLAGLMSSRQVLRDARLSRIRLWARAAVELAEIERLTGLVFY